MNKKMILEERNIAIQSMLNDCKDWDNETDALTEAFLRGEDFAKVKKTEITMDGVDRMLKYGGGFVKTLAAAWYKADGINRPKLENTFGYFKEYQEQYNRNKTVE